MKKREIVATVTVMAAFGMSACGTRELELTANQVEVELGSELDTAVTSYVADADVAAKAVIDFSAVDMTKTGTYNATVTYKDQTAGFEVVVVDTTAPEITVADQVVVAAGEPLYAEDVITSIIEFSGEAGVVFSEPETSADGASADAGEESVEETEVAENTEMADEPTGEAENSETAKEEETESAVDSAESTEEAELETEFILDDVLCSNAYVIYPETGEYDNTLTVTDASGNSTDVTVHIVVGDAPEIEGVEDMTVTLGTGADEIDFLDGVTAKDSSGNDITANIVCDSATVDLTTVGGYEVTYTVTDKDGFTATQTATVIVEEKGDKKSDSKKSDSGKTDSAKKNNSSSSSSSSNSSNNNNAASNGASGGNNASSGNSNQASGDSGNSGNNASSGNSNNASGDNGNSGNNNQVSGGSSTSGDSGNSGSSGNASTPSTDNGGNTGTPSAPAPAPETPSTPSADSGNTGSSSSGGMTVPDGIVIEDFDPSENQNADNSSGADGGDVTDVGTN